MSLRLTLQDVLTISLLVILAFKLWDFVSSAREEDRDSSTANRLYEQIIVSLVVILAVKLWGLVSSAWEEDDRDSSDANRLYEQGCNYFHDGKNGQAKDLRKAVELWQKAAAMGHTKAMHRLEGLENDHKLAPSLTLDQQTIQYFRPHRPFDVFLIHTGLQKKEQVDTMKDLFETGGLKCFFDQRMENADGAPTIQMAQALETCRYAVVLISKAFLNKRHPCAELNYAFRKNEWLGQQRDSWRSLWIVLYDLTVDEYSKVREYSQGNWTLPELGSRFVIAEWNKGHGKNWGWSKLCKDIRRQIVQHDNERAITNWKRLLREWGSLRRRNFPFADGLYSPPVGQNEAVDQGSTQVTDRVIDAYFAMQCQPSKFLRNLDGRPEMLRDLDAIQKYIEGNSGPGELFDRDYKVWLTDASDVAKDLKAFHTRVFVWCARGIDECSKLNSHRVIEMFCSAIQPEVVVICFEFGARRIAEQLHEKLMATMLVWVSTNPFDHLEALCENCFLPFCSSYLKGDDFACCVQALTSDDHDCCSRRRCSLIPGDFNVLPATVARTRRSPRKSLEASKAVTPELKVNLWSTVSLNWDRTLKQLRVDHEDFECLDDIKAKLSPEDDDDEHHFIYLKPQSPKACKATRALALCGCLDMVGQFRDGIYRVSSCASMDLKMKGDPRRVLIWVDLIHWKPSPFCKAGDLIVWLNGLGQNLTATFLLTSDSDSVEALEELVAELQRTSPRRVDVVELTDALRLREIPVKSLVGTFAISPVRVDGGLHSLLDLDHRVTPKMLAENLQTTIFSHCQTDIDDRMFDESLYRGDDGSVHVRFFPRYVSGLTKLRDWILLGEGAKRLSDSMDCGKIEFDQTSMAEVFESKIMQLETLTDHQREKLRDCEDALVNKKSIHIKGMAGTGKTFLALNLVLDYLEVRERGHVVYVSIGKSTAYQFCKWMTLRLGRRSDVVEAFERLLVLTDETKEKPINLCRLKYNDEDGLLRERDSFKPSEKKFDDVLLVVDEAHDVFDNERTKTASGAFHQAVQDLLQRFSTAPLVLLSDASQASVREADIHYPMTGRDFVTDIELTEVCRCTKRIILGARCFQLYTNDDVNVSHESDGIASVPLLFPRASSSNKFKCYADKVWEAIQHAHKRFPNLDLHHRLALVVPDKNFREGLSGALGAIIDDNQAGNINQQIRLVTAFEVCASLPKPGHPNRVSGIVLDSVANMAGLEFLIVMGVGLDASFDDKEVSPRSVCSRIFRAITRAQLLFYFINEEIEGGWYEWMAYVEFDGKNDHLDYGRESEKVKNPFSDAESIKNDKGKTEQDIWQGLRSKAPPTGQSAIKDDDQEEKRETPKVISSFLDTSNNIIRRKTKKLLFNPLTPMAVATSAERQGIKKILWVDDKPSNNTFEATSLTRRGFHITNCTSTNGARKMLREGEYDVIISDVHRIEDGEEHHDAGYQLLNSPEVEEVPFIFYTANVSYVDQDRSEGALGAADEAYDLFKLVMRAVQVVKKQDSVGR